MAQDISDIADAVEHETTLLDGVSTMVAGLLARESVDPAVIARVRAALATNKTKFEEVLLAGTPQAPPA